MFEYEQSVTQLCALLGFGHRDRLLKEWRILCNWRSWWKGSCSV